MMTGHNPSWSPQAIIADQSERINRYKEALEEALDQLVYLQAAGPQRGTTEAAIRGIRSALDAGKQR